MAAEYAFDLNYNAAPGIEEPQQQQEPAFELKKVAKPKVNKKQLEKKANIKIAKIFVVMACSIALFGVFCNSMVTRDESRRNLESAKTELSRNIDAQKVLNSDLSKLAAADNIEKIATQRLGLVKVTKGNEVYLDNDSGNRVIVSQNGN